MNISKMQKVFICITIFAFICMFSVSKIDAFTIDVPQGSSIIIPKYQLYVDGTEVNDPKKILYIGTKTPTFFGYTLSNVIVSLTLNSPVVKKDITTNNTGYWIYILPQPLSPGIHTLYMHWREKNGASTAAKLAATFSIPKVLGNSTRKILVPQPSLEKFNYLTVSLLIAGGVLISFIAYLLIGKLHTHTDA